MSRSLISKYTKETLQFFGQPISFLLRKQTTLLLIAVAVTECAFASAAWGLSLYMYNLPGVSGQSLGFELSFVTATYFIVSLTTASFFGSFSDRYGRRPFLIIGTAIAGISFIPFPVIYPHYSDIPFGFLLLAFANGLKGLAVAMISGPVLAVFADLSPEEHHGETMGKFYLAKSAGSTIGYPFGLVTWQFLGESAFFFFTTVMFTATLIYVFKFFEPRKGSLLEDEEVVVMIDSSQSIKNTDIEINPFKTMIDSLQDKQFRKFALVLLAYTTLVGAGAFVTPILIANLIEEVGFLIAVIGFVGICILGLMQPIIGKLSDNIGRKPFLIIGIIGTSMLLMIFASIIDFSEDSVLLELINDPFSLTKNIELNLVPDIPLPLPHIIVILMILVFAISASCFASSSLGLISDVAKSEHRGREMGLSQALMATGNVFGAIVGGYFIGQGPNGIIGVLTFCFILSLISIIIIVNYLYETSGFYHFTHKLV